MGNYRLFTENLVMYVTVQMFHQLPVGEAGVCLQHHKGDLCTRTEYVPAAQASLRQACRLLPYIQTETTNEACQAHSH